MTETGNREAILVYEILLNIMVLIQMGFVSTVDIDECNNPSTCAVTETCFNARGSYKCISKECPTNYQRKNR